MSITVNADQLDTLRQLNQQNPDASEFVLDYVDAWLDVRVLDGRGEGVDAFELDQEGRVHKLGDTCCKAG